MVEVALPPSKVEERQSSMYRCKLRVDRLAQAQGDDDAADDDADDLILLYLVYSVHSKVSNALPRGLLRTLTWLRVGGLSSSPVS